MSKMTSNHGNHFSCRPPSQSASRLFNIEDRYGPNPDLSRIEIPTGANKPKHMTFLTCANSPPCTNCGSFYAHVYELVIAVDGPCRFNAAKTPSHTHPSESSSAKTRLTIPLAPCPP